jgi:hypothetical protein
MVDDQWWFSGWRSEGRGGGGVHISVFKIRSTGQKMRGRGTTKVKDVELSPNFQTFEEPRIDSKEPIPSGCVAWRVGTTTLFLLGS